MVARAAMWGSGYHGAEVKKDGLGPFGTGPSKLLKNPASFSPRPGELLKIIFFELHFVFIGHLNITSRLLFQPVEGGL